MVRVVDGRGVRELLPMATCIEKVADALASLARGDAVQPLRMAVWQPDRAGLLGVMPAWLGGDVNASGVKVVSVFPGNHGSELDAHQGVVLLFEGEQGRLLAIIDASEVTAIRTAAASAVATRVLAREDARELLVVGTGIQARTHVEAIACVRELARVRVHGRDLARARAFAERESARLGVTVEAVEDLRGAVASADIVCLATSAKTPVLRGEWLRAGTHVNAVGACTPAARELDGAAVARARLYCDRRESLFAEAGDFLLARAEGLVSDAHVVGEIGEVLIGAVVGRRDVAEITLFESLGLGIEDVAVAHHIHARACERGVGIELAMGGTRT
jgi:ornithine cyclodeaminase